MGSPIGERQLCTGARVLFVFEQERCLQGVFKAFQNVGDWDSVRGYFLFSHLELLQKDFFNSWWYYDRQTTTLF